VTTPALLRDAELLIGFARDASGLELVPEALARPGSGDEVRAVLAAATKDRIAVTPAGGQTSTTGASITDQGILLSLRGLGKILDVDRSKGTARAEAGVIVSDLKRAAAAEGWLLPLDPTSEEDCTIGGAVACNATGARSLRYGDTRRHVRAITVALADGSVREFRRPQFEKNTVGYHFVQDPVDWFIGSEGTLGVILAVEFALLPLPAHVTGLGVPFANQSDALAFVAAARESSAVAPRCLEYLDAGALEIVRAHAGGSGWQGGGFVYTEEAGADGSFDPSAWLALAERHHAKSDDVVLYEGEGPLREARKLRHSVPATMNERSARARPAGGRKVSTDWAVPYRELGAVLEFSRQAAAKQGMVPAIAFGHAGNGHPHQNWIAKDAAELKTLEQVVETTLREVLRRGGTVAAEHGIGKIKSKWVGLQLSPLQVSAMRALKRELDPLGLLAPGNILP
jgi:FAD/FMN-containing dehydrogenase